MHYLTVEGLSKSYGIDTLFSGITFHIEAGDKIALVARNGSGKSTLLRILSGHDTPDTGTLWLHRDVLPVFFEQEPVFLENETVLDNIFHHDHPLTNAIRDYEAACDDGSPEGLSAAVVRMDELGAWDVDAKVKQILQRLEIRQFHQPLSTLSGGQRKRVALARTLIDIGFEKRHVLLLMDEPTNHLDVGMVEWLESYLDRENLTLLLVTHDRYFLDAVCDEIWELDGDALHVCKGDYATYLDRKAARLEQEASSIEKAQNIYRRELDWMRRQPQARTTKSRSRQDRFYDVEARAKTRVDDQQMELQVKMNRLGGKVAELKKVYKRYGDRIILKGFDYTFKKGERVGIIGRNGTGKSTFIRLILGLEEADSGKINIGETIVFGHYSQEGLLLKNDMRVIEFVKSIAESFPLAKGGSLSAAQFLERFLFPPEQQYTYVSHLSGGEKKRLHLLSILFRNPNFLILDEPTNDLDLPTQGVLEDFLSDYPGCLLVISHDRYFMDRLVDHLLVFEGDGEVRDFPGNYAIYRASQEAGKVRNSPSEAMKPQPLAAAELLPQSRKMTYRERKEFEGLDGEMAALLAERAAVTEQMSREGIPFSELEKLSRRILEIQSLLDTKEMRWLELSEREP
ncbi:MAG: ABC-F family ATP-binding cassette domain-containing protein [Bacteroidetes bacterium]|nr:ABC-F family ATP-binding cassette domain-containing protein [Bacteroidota bacterium]